MKRVTAFIASPRKQATYKAVQELERNLKAHAEIDFEYVFLYDYQLENCRGCCLCFDKGEEHCPLKDDLGVLLQKLNESDGVIFATPSYSFQVTATMKCFLDRLAFVFHRPQFFGKVFMAVVTYGIIRGASIVRYLEFVGENFGFRVVRGCGLMTLEPRTEGQQASISQKIKKAALRLHRALTRQDTPSPSLMRLAVFRLSRTSLKLLRDKQSRDYRYFDEKGWFESDYYYDAPLGFIRRLLGRLTDSLMRWLAKRR